MIKFTRSVALASLAAPLLSLSGHAQTTIDTFDVILLTDETPPGTTGTFSSFDNPFISDFSEVVFFANFASSSDEAIYGTIGGDDVYLVAREGDSAPGTDTGSGNSTFQRLYTPSIGEYSISFSGRLDTINGTTGATDTGIWYASPNSTNDGYDYTLIAREGSSAVGTGGDFDSLNDTILAMNDDDEVAFESSLLNTASNADQAVFLYSGSLSKVLQTSSTTYSNFGNPALSDTGISAFRYDLQRPPAAFDADTGIRSSSVSSIVQEKDAAPGFSGTFFSQLENKPFTSINESGYIAFQNNTYGTTPLNISAWRSTSTGLELIAKEGDAIPGAASGVEIADNTNFGVLPEINSRNDVLFQITITDTGGTPTTDQALLLFSDSDDALRTIFKDGDSTPGITGGTFNFLESASAVLNNFGDVVFLANIEVPDGSGTDDINSLWFYDYSEDSLSVVVKEGDEVDVDRDPQTQSDLREVTNVHFQFHADDTLTRRRYAVNSHEDGVFAFRLSLKKGTEFSEGIFVSSLPVTTATCKADVNEDGELTPTDFTAWINAFNNGDPLCDQNCNGSCEPTDFTAWIANYNAGCEQLPN